MTKETDFLDELIAEGESETPGFALIVQAALHRRRLLRGLAEHRVELGLSQTAVAAEMGTSQSAVARIESGKADVRMSTVERYAATLGRKVEWRIAPGTRQARASKKRRHSAKSFTSSRSKKAVARRKR
ncbi:MAG: helix-turn-helix domain-containing protein [Actinomycetota bacterium]